MTDQIAGSALHISREQAHQMTLYPELLARLVDMLTQQLEHRAAQLTGTPNEFIDVVVLAEVRVMMPEETA